MNKTLGLVGFWAFVIGFILAVVAGLLWPQNATVILILLILGLLIGFLNISGSESMLFLVAAIALVVAGNVFTPITTLSIGEKLGNILTMVGALMAPAAIVVAVKALYKAAKPG
jgi:ATP synthase protein I